MTIIHTNLLLLVQEQPDVLLLLGLLKKVNTLLVLRHHISGTCKMDPDDDMGVVNSKLKIKGVNGLRIVDTSIYPPQNLHAYNPSRGIYMIAKMISDVIKEE